MAATSVTRRFTFDAGHRVYGHAGRCSSIHGHTYTVELTVAARFLDGLEMVIDFAVLKERFGGWLDAHLDHGMMLNSDDPLASVYESSPAFDKMKVYVFVKKNPTAEVLARYLYVVAESMFQDIDVRSVKVWETASCSAAYPELEVR